MALPCIVCKKCLENVFEIEDRGNYYNHPNDGVTFTAPGQYGSTVFDPMDGTSLEVNVCDECLIAAAKAREVLLNAPIVGQDIYTSTHWTKPWEKE